MNGTLLVLSSMSSNSSSSSANGSSSFSSSDSDSDDEDDEDISGFRLAGADRVVRAGMGPPGGTLFCMRSLRLASISAAPLNLGMNGIGILRGPAGADLLSS